ncbi:MAG TPA: hypothetical protein ACQGQI_08640 [Xylella sp.]
MMKVADILRDAFGHVRVIDANEAMEAEDALTALRALNLMMRDWKRLGLAPAWVEVSSPDDELPAPQEAEESIACNLAVRLRARYGATLDQDVIQHAQNTLSSLLGQRTLADKEFIMRYELPAAENQRSFSADDFFQ